MINLENEEVTPDFELKDFEGVPKAVFKPKIIVVTSFYEMYKNSIFKDLSTEILKGSEYDGSNREKDCI